MQERWGTGIWIGKRWVTDEHLVSLPNGRVVGARDVRAAPADEAFDKKLFLGVRGTPSNPSALEQGEDGILRNIPRAPVERVEQPTSGPVPRQVILHKSYFVRWNYTNGCLKCRAML